jgi:D-sedoheptulose 7-phosphate isomerase
LAGPADIALGLSTSGSSVNLLRAFEQARQIGALTIGLAGYGGGTMAEAGTVDHCLVVSSDSVHRIQEAQSAVTFELWRRVQSRLVEGVLDDH